MNRLGIAASALIALAAAAAPEEVSLAARPATNDFERSLETCVRDLYRDAASEDIEVRRSAFLRVMAGRDDLKAVFGEDSELVWPRLGPRLEEVLGEAPRMEGLSRRRGYLDNILTVVELVDLRLDPRCAALAAMIPADIPAYRVVTHRKAGVIVAESGPYMHVGGRWLWMPGAELAPRIVRYLKKRGGNGAVSPDEESGAAEENAQDL
ncbi:MAG: hypothetical protein FJ224_02410 [Lentisphaerae bacterium]|nr:hypothetical protein [Lentisphaerota bacterium]